MKRGLIGAHLSHSFSKLIHEQLEPFSYDLIELESVSSFLAKKEFLFVNVTIPFKQDVIPYCDELSDVARAIGAVNTLINRQGRLLGYNTDYDGFLYLLHHFNVNVHGKKIAIFGTGGASHMVQYALRDESFIVFSRGPQGVSYDDKDTLATIQVIINTTPNTMYPHVDDHNLIQSSDVPLLETVVDLIYNPLRTPLMMMAPHAVNGLMMLVYQAVRASEYVYQKKYSDATVMRMYKSILNDKLNIALIGMPMSGKTHLSRQLATRLNKSWVDIDKLIEEQQNMSINEIFNIKGEPYFRQLESSMIRDVSIQNNLIISPGGGTVLSLENMKYLQMNALIIFIDMDITFLSRQDTSKRPLLSTPQSIMDLYEKRINLYKKYADKTIKRYNYEDDAITKLEGVIREYLNT